MPISITDPQFQTFIFGVLFLLTLFISIRRGKSSESFALSKTLELKGFAILTIIFSHIGYFLSQDTTFLWPFSIMAGVGVNLFLFLSGFGLTLSSLRSHLSIAGFYKKRLLKLFIPMWVVVVSLIVLDFVILHRTYSLQTIAQALVGFFPRANLFTSLDAPLWYFTAIFFYYLVFPLFFWKRFRYLSPLLMVLLSYIILSLPLPVDPSVFSLYQLHTLAFPLGVLFALLMKDAKLGAVRSFLKRLFLTSYIKYPLITVSTLAAAYVAVNSGVGQGLNIEQAISLFNMLLVVYIFLALRWEFTFLNLYGKYSYEIYLIHAPLLFRYEILYKLSPAFLATYIYLILFLLISYFLQKTARVRT